MEKAAMAAYLKDVESNTRDMTADTIIHEKWNKKEKSKQEEEPDDPNRIPYAAPETNPRFKESTYLPKYGAADIDPLDPFAKQKLARLEAREAKAKKEAAKNESKSQGKGKSEKNKGKGKQSEAESSGNTVAIRKVWYEAKTQGYSYYWNTETNETSWEPPAEGFMSLAEQAEEAKEQALQEEFLKEIEDEEEKDKAELREEQRANAEREKLKEIRKRFLDSKKTENNAEEEEANDSEEEKIPYRRDYSVPDKPQPYGSWQVVKKIEKPKIDLQLPKAKKSVEPVVNYDEPPPPSQKVFKEKTITHISTGDSDDDGPSVSFKRRKFGNKNVRKRMDED